MSLLCPGPGEEWPTLRDPRGCGDTCEVCPPGLLSQAGRLLQANFRKLSSGVVVIALKCFSLFWGHGEDFQILSSEQIFFLWTTSHRKTCLQTKRGALSMGQVGRSYLCLISCGWWRTAGATADAAGLLNFRRLYGRASFLSPRLCQDRQEHLLESLFWRKKASDIFCQAVKQPLRDSTLIIFFGRKKELGFNHSPKFLT